MGLMSSLQVFLFGAACMAGVTMWMLAIGYVIVRVVKRERSRG